MPNFGNIFSLQTCLNGRSQFLKVVSELKEIQGAAVSRLQSFPASGFFSNESVLLIRWPKYWSFSYSISPSNEYSGQISFRVDWLDLLAVQGTLKSLLQHHSSKASVLWHSVFYVVQLSHPYMTTGKTIALTRWTFLGKVMSLFFNMLCRLVIAFLPRSKHLLSIFDPSENPTKATKEGLFKNFFGVGGKRHKPAKMRGADRRQQPLRNWKADG